MNKIFSILAVVSLFFAACTKESLDGEATLVVKPAHHGTPIVSSATYQDSVFVKFDATEIPADPTHDYDALIVGAVGEDHIHVEHPTKGNYSIYCTGWDTSINERVKGGVVIEIKRKDRKDEIVVDVPVTE